MITNEQTKAAYDAFLGELTKLSIPFRNNYVADRDIVKFQQGFNLFGVLKVAIAAAVNPESLQDVRDELAERQAAKQRQQLRKEDRIIARKAAGL